MYTYINLARYMHLFLHVLVHTCMYMTCIVPQLYDLHIGRVGEHSESQDGCPVEQRHCGQNDVTGLTCGRNGDCIGNFVDDDVTCVCKPGWRGPGCSIRELLVVSRTFSMYSHVKHEVIKLTK